MEDTTAFLAEKLKDSGSEAPFVILDDASPERMDVDRLVEITKPFPFFYMRLPKNMGCGGKENILQYVLSQRSDYVLRWDSDIRLDGLSLENIAADFESMNDAWAITSCITYFARLEASQLPEEQNHFSGSNIADFVAYRSSAFEHIGYSDPELRVNEDGDLRLRALAKRGWKCYVDKRITGKAIPSGAGTPGGSRNKIGEYIAKTRPFIKVSYPKSGQFRIRLDKAAADTAKDFMIEPHPYAKKIAQALWK
jgi:hypothetical protein